MLSISNLHVSVGDKPILKGLNLIVPGDEVHAAMRPNGALAWYANGEGEPR